MDKLPPIPVRNYYVFCPSCDDIKAYNEYNSVIKGDDPEILSGTCDCGYAYAADTAMMASTPKQAYEGSIHLLLQLNSTNTQMITQLREREHSLLHALRIAKAAVPRANSLIYTMEKFFKDVYELIEVEDYKGALNECLDALVVIDTERENSKEQE